MTTETLMTEGQPTNTADQQQDATTEAPATEAAATQQQEVEGQAAEGEQPEADNAEANKAKPEGAPEKYEFKAPEGHEFDAHVIEQFSEVARELNLPNEAAQKVIDKIAPALAKKQADALDAVRNQWAEDAKADKEFGGAKLTENLTVAKKALDTFGTPELRTLLDESGLGNNPEVIRFMVKAGKAISEDGFVSSGRSAQESDPAKRLFPNQK
ncbi:MAG: protease [Gammaproteobacteria bacterium]|nr:protease [Gammaproteobacteria bacterium]MBU1732276.1 protease [Gammaproteobacteria bacterium]MBU1893846.1 protease [Gammaproteobacteria bacterium]